MMKKIVLALCTLALTLVSFTANAEYLRGDVDQNGNVGISDVSCLIDYLLSGAWEDGSVAPLDEPYQRGDVDRDGSVGINDVACLIDYLLSGTWGDEPVTPPDEHEFVDLGLPSGTLWATMNVGATAPEDCGDYFAWGETAPKEVYNWASYKWCNGSYKTMTKYCTSSSYGTVDDKTELELEDDAAYANWGPSWRIPTKEQQDELRNNCTWTWTTMNGVKGEKVTGPNSNTIFLPAAGCLDGNTHYDLQSYGYYWSRTLHADRSFYAYYIMFYPQYVDYHNYHRYQGFSVRPVRISQ